MKTLKTKEVYNKTRKKKTRSASASRGREDPPILAHWGLVNARWKKYASRMEDPEPTLAEMKQTLGFDLVLCPNGHRAGRLRTPTRHNPLKETIACQTCHQSWWSGTQAIVAEPHPGWSVAERRAEVETYLRRLSEDTESGSTGDLGEFEQMMRDLGATQPTA